MSDLRIFALVAVLAVTGVAVVGASYSDAAIDRDDAAFEIEVVHDEAIDLEGTELEDVVVEDSDGTTLEEGTDYDINHESGAIQFHGDGATDEGDIVEITYSAMLPAELAEALASPIGQGLVLIGIVSVVLAVAFVLASLAHFPGARGGGF